MTIVGIQNSINDEYCLSKEDFVLNSPEAQIHEDLHVNELNHYYRNKINFKYLACDSEEKLVSRGESGKYKSREKNINDSFGVLFAQKHYEDYINGKYLLAGEQCSAYHVKKRYEDPNRLIVTVDHKNYLATYLKVGDIEIKGENERKLIYNVSDGGNENAPILVIPYETLAKLKLEGLAPADETTEGSKNPL